MSVVSPLGSYRPNQGPLHRLTPGPKLAGLFLLAIAVVWVRGVPATFVALGVGVVLALLAGLRGKDLWRVVRGFSLIAVPLLVFTAVSSAYTATPGGAFTPDGGLAMPPASAWLAGWARAVEVVGDLFALILAASALTASTAVEDMLDTITRGLGPLRRFGVRPERIALAFSIMIRAIPSILGIARETQSAARARGLERNPRARVVPLVLRTVAHAQLTGEALTARGIGEDDDEATNEDPGEDPDEDTIGGTESPLDGHAP